MYGLGIHSGLCAAGSCSRGICRECSKSGVVALDGGFMSKGERT